jgi:hypothetical protein
LLAYLLIFFNPAIGQEDQVVPKVKRNDYKNVVKFNLSTQILYENTLLFGYERVIKKHQTLNISGGYLEFPISLNLPEFLQLKEQKSKSGYNIGLDWRFYLANENKHAPPHGLYLAPFVAIHHFKSVRDIIYTDTLGNVRNAVMNNKINFLTIGGQLGYQFVIKRRFVIDAVLVGPGVTNYRFNVKLDGNLSDADKEAITAKIIEALHDKIPLLDEIAKGEEVSGSGVQSFWSAGFRYSLSIGFRF